MSATGKTDTATTCFCGTDGDVNRLRQLIAAGMDQWEASRLLCVELPPSPALATTAPGSWAARFVRYTLATALPWLRLPKPTRPEVS